MSFSIQLRQKFDPSLQNNRKGVGAGLLRDTMQRTVQAVDIAGISAFLVHAKNNEVKAFYQHFDFIPSSTDPYHHYLLVKDIRKTMSVLTDKPQI